MANSNFLFFSVIFVALCLLSQVKAGISFQSSYACHSDYFINVNGQGKISVQPDIALINVGISATAKTSQEASQTVATKLGQINQILISNKIKKEDISTQSLSIYPQYDYPDGKAVFSGQTAQQTLSVKVRGIDKTGGNLGLIIDQLVKVDGIQFNGLSFDKEDKSEAKKQARKLAFDDAKEKAKDYARLAERKLGRVLTIVDDAVETPSNLSSNVMFAATKSFAATEVPFGKLDISYTVNVKFELR